MFEQLKNLVVEELGVSEADVVETASFKEDLGADSLDLFELAMSLETAFDIEIPTEELEKIVTVGDALRYIQSKQA